MGNSRSSIVKSTHNVIDADDPWWKRSDRRSTTSQFVDLDQLRERRQRIIGEKRKEMQDLRQRVRDLEAENARLHQGLQNEHLKTENEQLRHQVDLLMGESKHFSALESQNDQLQSTLKDMQLQLEKLQAQASTFESERHKYGIHVNALKDVVRLSKQMLCIREGELRCVQEKLEEIQATVRDREQHVLSQDLREEYERQLQNIRRLRSVYEERQRADATEKRELRQLLEERKRLHEEELAQNKDVQETVQQLETTNSQRYDEIKTLESNLGLARAECRQLQAELTVINQLFSQILLGFNNNQDLDIDRLIRQLEEHHDLLQNLAINNNQTVPSAALPKVFLDLVNDLNHSDEQIAEDQVSASSGLHQFHSTQEIVDNLPKVWRILIELLSHQLTPAAAAAATSSTDSTKDPCYKTVHTSTGPNLVLSVSQTFIRLKDLILEKRALEKETHHLKQLNTHLESRLQDHETRLHLVTAEVSKTWRVVDKLQKQHHKLHTQEKILRYELSQKRQLLNDLKAELQSSRDIWQQARDKNSNTEREWKQLRKEFASRKEKTSGESSGYSDDKEGTSSDDDSLNQKNKEGFTLSTDNTGLSLEQIFAARESRLQRLESMASGLVQQVTHTAQRSVDLCTKLDNLHEVHGNNHEDNADQ